jgi:hypothetical protein
MRFVRLSSFRLTASSRRCATSLLAMGCMALLVAPLHAESETGLPKKRRLVGEQSQQLANAPAFGSGETKRRLKKSEQPLSQPVQTNFNGGTTGGKATTETEVVIDKGVLPILSASAPAALESAISRYESIAARGGWGKVNASRLSKGDQGEEVTQLKRRLVLEGYLPQSTLEGEKGITFTTALEQALKQYQINHGLAPTGKLDKATAASLNVPVTARLATLRANLPRIAEYSKDLGPRYIVVNIPALQLEAVQGGRVFSRHNVIVGKPERPSPIVMTSLSDINFNPYWNVPVSIVERDLIPQMLKGGTQVIKKQNIRIFDGYQGPEVDPDDVDWASTPPERYFFRQDPGQDNAMATVKINFPSPFGVYMHDTPTRSLFGTAGRYLSSGCVRIDKVPILVNWILNGQDGWGPARIEEMARSQERLDVKIQNPPQLRWVYLTAWATSTGQVNFRDDIYELDRSGFVVGQPMPVGEYSDDGQRYVLKPIPRPPSAASSDAADDGFSLFGSGTAAKKPAAKDKPEKGSTLGYTTTQSGTLKKKPAASATTKTAAKSSGTSTFDRLRKKAQPPEASAEEPEEPPKLIKKKKKSVQAAKVTPTATTPSSSKPAPSQN